jgi:sporulation integral membrane protein YlbJ
MTKKLNAFLELIFFGFLLFASVLLALDRRYSVAVTNGISLWIACVLPALFPYFFITFLLSSLKITGKLSCFLSPLTTKLLNVSGLVGYAFIISVISGYPVGAKTVSDLKESGAIDDAESVRASCLCSTSSPMFLLGSVGNLMFKNSAFGILLFLSHLISAISVGIIFSFYKRKTRPKASPPFKKSTHVDNVLYESALSSVLSVLVVGALITVFYLLTELLLSLNVLTPLINLLTLLVKDKNTAKSIVLGLFECTKGLSLLSSTPFNLFSLPISSLICSFGGLSVIAQSVAYLKKAKIKTAPFILSKIISAVISFFISLLFSAVFL